MHMRWRIALCVFALASGGVACEMPDDTEPEASPPAAADSLDVDEFTLTGVVIDAKEGAQPADGIPGEDDAVTSTVGGIAIRPEGVVDAAGLDGCSMTQDAFVTYYTSETDAAGLEDDDAWPETLEGREVTVDGARHEADATDADETDASPAAAEDDDDDECVLVVETIRPADATPVPAPDDGGTGAGQTTTDDGADGDSSPRPTEEVVWVWPSPADFPEHEDTDPIFEGTPSPDPCEGAKACEEKRREEEAREEAEESP
jgi:hypothetical protein